MRSRRRGLQRFAAPLVVAALLHWTLLGGAEALVGATPAPSTGTLALTVRTVEPPAATVPAAAPPPSARHAAQAPTPKPRPAAPSGAIATPTAAEPLPADTADVELVARTELLPATHAAEPATADGDMAVPLYRTRMPPAMTLHYDLRRGFFSGSGDLKWKPADHGYEARLEGSVAGLQVITQVSRGNLDEHGLAPLRYTDQRLRRTPNAANFQRDKGKITYSGPQVEYPLVPGAQDRLSWMIQIAGVLNAAPELAAPGGRITFFVTGARGDADVWVFRYVGTEDLRADGGQVRAVKFTREPRSPYDRMVEVWLAPQRHHLPVRARLTAEAGGEVFELLLRDMQPP
ncbi:MAG TPA: DUF3108 domain-containing protein [Albitalea sp.]|nr:DUF3108 domain-containing protein [Albitalea sp.]